MKISVFPRGSNPAIDRHIQRKSLSYCEGEVQALRADWVNPNDAMQGIICRDFLYFGQKLTPAAPEQVAKLSRRNALSPIEVSNTQFDDPQKSLLKREDRYTLLVRAEAFARFANMDRSVSAQA